MRARVCLFLCHPESTCVSDSLRAVQGQVNELNIVRRSLLDLEAQHGRVRQQYDDELGRLRAQLRHLEMREREREREADREERMDVESR